MKLKLAILVPASMLLIACETSQLKTTQYEPTPQKQTEQVIESQYGPLENVDQDIIAAIDSGTTQAPEELNNIPQSEEADAIFDLVDSMENKPSGDPLELAADAIDSSTSLQPESPMMASMEPESDIIHFKFGSVELTDANIANLEQYAQFLLANPEYRMDIEGHSDKYGPDDVNQKLSLKRAEQIKAFMEAQGVPLFQLTTIGYGASKPISDIARDNRRVEIHFDKTVLGLSEETEQ